MIKILVHRLTRINADFQLRLKRNKKLVFIRVHSWFEFLFHFEKRGLALAACPRFSCHCVSGIMETMDHGRIRYGVPPEQRDQRGRKFIGVQFTCCGVYSRIYFNEKENGYFGTCPLCRRRVRVRVDAEKGIDSRFFRTKI